MRILENQESIKMQNNLVCSVENGYGQFMLFTWMDFSMIL